MLVGGSAGISLQCFLSCGLVALEAGGINKASGLTKAFCCMICCMAFCSSHSLLSPILMFFRPSAGTGSCREKLRPPLPKTRFLIWLFQTQLLFSAVFYFPLCPRFQVNSLSYFVKSWAFVALATGTKVLEELIFIFLSQARHSSCVGLSSQHFQWLCRLRLTGGRVCGQRMSCRGLVRFMWPAWKEEFMELKMVSHKDRVQFCLLVILALLRTEGAPKSDLH